MIVNAFTLRIAQPSKKISTKIHIDHIKVEDETNKKDEDEKTNHRSIKLKKIKTKIKPKHKRETSRSKCNFVSKHTLNVVSTVPKKFN